MNSFTPLLFVILLSLALEIRHRRSVGGLRWRPGEDLGSDRDEARRIADLAAIARPSVGGAQSGSPRASHRGARKTQRTTNRPMHTVVS